MQNIETEAAGTDAGEGSGAAALPAAPPPDWQEEREALKAQVSHGMRLLWCLAHHAGGETRVTSDMLEAGRRGGARLEIIPVEEGKEFRIRAVGGGR